ncbi:MAG: DUF3916 domain-containing protein [Hyphomonadaceae bacterium]|nr:DUF3916 domain-containing protein [Hyphomonadaceae bacterium]
MRRLDLHPRRKLRNPGRHLRQLSRWPERIVDQLPGAAQLEGQRFWNFKVPVFAKVIEPPHATPETQRACIAAIFAAAEAVERSTRRPKNCRVACLVTTPFLFESEVTLFKDEDYFRSFLPPPKQARTALAEGSIEAGPADVSALPDYVPSAPKGLEFFGGATLSQFDPSWGDKPVGRINWVWAYDPR